MKHGSDEKQEEEKAGKYQQPPGSVE